MNAGEPPDEEGDGEGDGEGRSTDPSGDTTSDGTGGDPPADDADEGTDAELDPAQEVEAAVEDVMGPGVPMTTAPRTATRPPTARRRRVRH